MNCLAFGEILWDIIDGKKFLGGAPLNFATHFVKCFEQASLISAVGKDKLGKLAEAEIQKLGVDTSLIQVNADYKTGTVDVSLTKEGQPDYKINSPVAYDFISKSFRSMIAKDFDIFYFGTLSQRNAKSQDTLYSILTSRKFKHIFFDINLRKDCYNEVVIRKSLSHCTILKINEEEVKIVSFMLFGKILEMEVFISSLLSEYNIETIIITCGSNGCFIKHGNLFQHLESEPVKVVDAVGAGDAFSAAFMKVFISTKNPISAGKIANRVGAFVVSHKGAIPKYSDELVKLLSF